MVVEVQQVLRPSLCPQSLLLPFLFISRNTLNRGLVFDFLRYDVATEIIKLGNPSIHYEILILLPFI